MIALETRVLAGLGDVRTRAERFTGVQVDSRRIAPGDLFVAVGRGAAYLSDALERGAAATIVPHDAFAALGEIARSVRARSSARVVGITGSMGKTSTKDILAALCNPVARTVAAEASYNNEIGVPLTLCRLEEDTQVCIVELAMRGFGQIADLCDMAQPEIGVITNVGPVHLELVDSLEGVQRAKGELIASLPAGGTAIVPMDFPGEREDIQIVRIGDVEGESREGRTTIDGVSFNFTARHQTQNAASALAAFDALGFPRPVSLDVDFSRWRGEESELPGGGLLINDAYNANPVSMRAALAHLAERAEGRRTLAILGDMAELGSSGPAYHREVGEAVAELGIDALFAVGPLAENYLVAGLPMMWWAEDLDLEAFIQVVQDELEPGDCVLVKASRAIGLEAVAAALTRVPSL